MVKEILAINLNKVLFINLELNLLYEYNIYTSYAPTRLGNTTKVNPKVNRNRHKA